MRVNITGRLWRLGDNVDTDTLFPGRFMTLGGANKQAALEGLSTLDPELARIAPGDAIVAGSNFGCGSSREYAVSALVELGVTAVIARSFARIFFRNAINLALPIVELETADELPEYGPVQLDLSTGVIVDPLTHREFAGRPLPDFLIDIMRSGGLMAHLRATLVTQGSRS